MKGIVFTEFFEMVEGSFGYEMVDKLIENCDLKSNGIYTSVGTYDHQEIIALVVELSKQTKTPVPDLVFAFGKYLFGSFHKGHPHFFEGSSGTLDFLEKVHGYIHVEVKKLYPDAMLPNFEYERPEKSLLIMDYHSDRAMSDLARGLITATGEFYEEKLAITTEDRSEGKGTFVRFSIATI